jgi:sentrin-specific protease 7
MNYEVGKRKKSEEIKVSDFKRLEPQIYLNDTLVNFYLKFIEEFLVSNETKSDLFAFNSFFMGKLT